MLRKELEESISHSIQQPTHMPVQGSTARDEVRWVLFREDNVEPGGYASEQTPETTKHFDRKKKTWLRCCLTRFPLLKPK